MFSHKLRQSQEYIQAFDRSYPDGIQREHIKDPSSEVIAMSRRPFSFVKNLGVNFPSRAIDTYRTLATIVLSARSFLRIRRNHEHQIHLRSRPRTRPARPPDRLPGPIPLLLPRSARPAGPLDPSHLLLSLRPCLSLPLHPLP
jgi:hypothetical protein